MGRPSLTALRNFVGAMLAGALLLGVFLPVYTDEVGWRFQERAAFDGVDKMYSEQCGPSTLARPPWFMMPVRHYSAFFNSHFADPLFVRISGILYALVWLMLVHRLAARLTNSPRRRAGLELMAFALLSLGVMPLLLVWSRPEQPILLCLTAALVLALPRPAKPGAAVAGEGAGLVAPVGIGLLAVIAASYHLKGVGLAPLFVLCLFGPAQRRGTLVPRLAIAMLVGLAAASALHYWTSRLSCPGDPVIAAMYAGQSAGYLLLGGTPLPTALGILLHNANPLALFALAGPVMLPGSFWLPPNQLDPALGKPLFDAVVLIWAVVTGAGAVLLGAGLWRGLTHRRIAFEVLMALGLTGFVLGWAALLNNKNPYEITLMLPLLALALLLVSAKATVPPELKRSAIGGLAALGAAATVSIVAVAATYGPALHAASKAEGYLPDQPFSVAAFNYGRVEPHIREAAALCGLTPDRPLRNLLVDDLTYFPFMRSTTPQHRLGVLGPWNGLARDPVAYLKGRGSDGAILGCQYLPPELRARAHARYGLCCLAPSQW